MKFEFTPYWNLGLVTNEEFIADLKAAFAANNSEALTMALYKKLGRYSPDAIAKRFGSWNKALVTADLPRKLVLNIPVIDLLINLKNVWETLGRQPRMCELRRPVSLYSDTTYRTAFGTWEKVLRKFIAFVQENEVPDAGCAVTELSPDARRKRSSDTQMNHRRVGWRMRHIVMKRDNFRCKACGASPARDPSVMLHVDHILPRSKGGESVLENLQTLCEMCNIGKGDLVD